ncbi:hypothetical protein [Rhizobium leguminosarum]|uniref:hypothetical protein n=1 Tax=Rhizobium leguminosarum TaxID=384 RepID=UPI001441B4A2|nr:hypothetical protein [Rhizobium leguminosarum]MBY5864390.1 hypothetical protein [Rhizobium leguminosarum]NKM03407.1 hypothetical protein [Rhizobium leguminosarum bv. viciae]
MPTIMIYHDVKDTKHWLASPIRKQVLEPIGVTNIRMFTDPKKSNRVGLVMDVADMEKLMAFMQTKAAADAMASDGVLPETMTFLVQSQHASRRDLEMQRGRMI